MIIFRVVALWIAEDKTPSVAVVQHIDVDVDDLETDTLADVDVVGVDGSLQTPLVQVLRVDHQMTVHLEDIITALENTFQGFQEARIVVPVANLVRVIMLIIHHIEVGRRSHS